MTTWVFRDGVLVDKSTVGPPEFAKRANFPTPRVSRFDEMLSPVTEKTISSWRERDRDMYKADAVDPRDIPAKVVEKRKAKVAAMKEADVGSG
jgi:hypothetical protein